MSLKTDDRARHAFREATSLRDEGRHDEALSILDTLLNDYPDSPAILGTIGGVLYAAKRFQEAKGYFARVLELRPQAELASLGLFHCLWALGEEGAARVELVRFLTDNESDEYAQLLQDMGWRFNRAQRVLDEQEKE